MSNSQEVTTANHSLPRLPPEDFASTEMVHAIFDQSVGNCYGSFPCTYSRQHGRIYVASRAVLFFSNIFGFERRLSMSLSEITDIKTYRSTSIWISMMDGEDFVFKSLSSRERVVAVVRTLLNNVMPRESSTIQLESEPSASPDSVDLTVSSQPGNPRVRAQSCPTEIHPEIIFESTRSDRPQVELLCEDKPTRKASNGEASFATSTCTENLMEDWKKEKRKQESIYKERAIDNVILNCSLSHFFDLFLADDAPHSMIHYQEQIIGDTQVKATKWKLDDDDCLKRTISFCHPIANNFGIGPSSTMATRVQTLSRYGDFGICLATTTKVSGVPGADAFHVADHWLVEEISSHEICFTVLHKTVFTKMTVFKRVIESSTKVEIKSWYTGYLAMLADHVQGQSKTSSVSPVQDLDYRPTVRKWFSVWPSPAVVVVLFALLVQNFVLNYQVRQLQVEVKSVHQQQVIALQLLREVLIRSTPADH
ncbi:hypothetical protein MHU86_13307 [Fragilaria crotonensis]|nr:hypothetical protein MHU86_13307 [Fragilaria crotonensis]